MKQLSSPWEHGLRFDPFDVLFGGSDAGPAVAIDFGTQVAIRSDQNAKETQF